MRRRRGDTDVEREDEEEDEDEERDDPLELLPLELLPLELLPLLAALLERELLVDAVRLFFVRSRLRSFLASADRTRLGLAAMIAVANGAGSEDWFFACNFYLLRMNKSHKKLNIRHSAHC